MLFYRITKKLGNALNAIWIGVVKAIQIYTVPFGVRTAELLMKVYKSLLYIEYTFS